MQVPGSSHEDCAEKLPTGWYDESARLDAADAEQPHLLTGDETALGYTNHLSISGKDVFLSQGDGVQP
jgi:hypothetical protein